MDIRRILELSLIFVQTIFSLIQNEIQKLDTQAKRTLNHLPSHHRELDAFLSRLEEVDIAELYTYAFQLLYITFAVLQHLRWLGEHYD